MAASIGEPVVLANDIKDPLIPSVNKCSIDGNVIVTQNPNLINIYKIENQKALQSWSTRHDEYITSPVIWDEHKQKYVTVTNKRTVKTWGKDEQNFGKSSTKTAKSTIKKILPSESTEPVVVFDNGAVAFLSKVKDTHEGPLSEKDNIFFCDLVQIGSDVCVLCLLLREDKVELRSYWYRNEGWIQHNTPVEVDTHIEIICCHAIPGRNNAKIFILCLNGDLLCQTLSFDQCSSQLLQTITGVHKTTKMVALNSTHIVLAGCTKDKQDVIGIYDVKFGAYEVWKTLPTSQKSVIKLFALGGHLFVLCHRTLYMFSYSCHSSSLASILGQQRVNTQPQGQTPPPGPLSWSKTKLSPSSTEASKLYSELQNISVAKTQKEFEKKFLSILKNHGDDPSGLLSETSTMEHIVQRCVKDEKLWSHNVLEQLLVHRLVPNRCIKEVAEGIVKNEDVPLLLQCLNLVNDIPEESLCMFTNFILGVEDSIAAEAVKNSGISLMGKSDSPLSEAKGHIINKIVKKPYNDIFIIECLHRITFQNVLTLMEYLCYLISNLDSQVSSMPDLAQIVNFICVLVDAHYQQLVLSPDSQEVLINLHQTVETQREYFTEFLALDVLLSQMKRQFAIPPPRAVGKYCIEVLRVY
uniref:Nucleolar protein 11-like n=1 Tax=Crassostrea virginica TaxID=6565 RepID=A0A8B8CEX9_CRAVI|nr:nucleolar protein 11-like [Crassostrea virginica]